MVYKFVEVILFRVCPRVTPTSGYPNKNRICYKMAAEWDNLIPDSRDMRAKNGPFDHEIKGTVKICRSRKVICVLG